MLFSVVQSYEELVQNKKCGAITTVDVSDLLVYRSAASSLGGYKRHKVQGVEQLLVEKKQRLIDTGEDKSQGRSL